MTMTMTMTTTTATTAPLSKGVGAWYFPGVGSALPDSGARWYYTWVPKDKWVSIPKGIEYVPMIWGAGNVNSTDLAAAKASGHTLLGFNEPDDAYQSNMSVTQALDAWPKLQATGLTLGSPATAYNAELAGSWLDQFMAGAKARGYRVDFIALHWYRWDGSVTSSVSNLKSFLTAVHNRYGLPVWLTEFAAINFTGGTHYASVSTQAAFLTAAASMMASLPFVQRYAWFAMPTWTQAPTAALYTDNAKITTVGKAFKATP
ncbi:glycosyl hydrolase [Subtercola frigoramans]|uniref:Asl1-like glycosyl hydrolase catalytic domain-containing protein n=1 Tax=Subtercola frigoramans TaxID=120298 RepID=A0ABS2L1B0_9MICO|nr:glycosyl hydrolase [Subtercola frigoramans]MBM7470858.1 hypothetical protein [Subtercola frigoramans]